MQDILRMVYASAKSIKAQGYELVIYTDTIGARMLGGFPYDDIKIIDMNEHNPSLFSTIKYMALEQEGLGAIHVDFDIILDGPVIDTSGQWDIIIQNTDHKVLYNNEIRFCKKIGFPENMCECMCEMSPYNVGVIGFNNSEAWEDFITNFREMSDRVRDVSIPENVILDLVLEQSYITTMCKKHHYTVRKVISDDQWGRTERGSIYPHTPLFSHYYSGTKWEQDIKEKILKRLTEEEIKYINNICIMDIATSYTFFKPDIKDWIIKNFSPDAKILDVGAGSGTYWNLLHDVYQNIDAVEVYEQNIIDHELKSKYKNVYWENIVDLKYDYYDLVIFGDVLEHLSINDAQEVLDYASRHCKDFIIAVPYCMSQDETMNQWEKHIQDDITPTNIFERYPALSLLVGNDSYGYYIKSRIPAITTSYLDPVDVICICEDPSTLQYTLRSIAKYGNNISRIIVVGECPDWLSEEVKIIPKLSGSRADMLLAVLDNIDDLSERIVVLIDGCVYFSSMNFSEYPHFTYITSEDPWGWGSVQLCDGLRTKTLKRDGLSTINFNINKGSVITKQSLEICRDRIKNSPVDPLIYIQNWLWTVEPFGLDASHYVELHGWKDWWKVDNGTVCAKICDGLVPGSTLESVFNDLFPDKCKFEK